MKAIAAILLLMLTSAGFAERPVDPAQIEIDHLILGIHDLDTGIAEFERLTGVRPERGGEHPGRGTENALVSLGDGRYLEILAPARSASKPAAIPFTRLTPSGWALRTSDLGRVVASLKNAGFGTVGPTPGSRRRPDGSLLEWQTASATGAALDLAPFFIQWSQRTTHPSTTSPGGCTLAGFELSGPHPEALQRLFDAVGYKAVLRTGEPGLRIMLRCPKGDVSLGERRQRG